MVGGQNLANGRTAPHPADQMELSIGTDHAQADLEGHLVKELQRKKGTVTATLLA